MRSIAIAALGLCAACKSSTNGGGSASGSGAPPPVATADAAPAAADAAPATGPTLASLAAVAEHPDAIAQAVAADPAQLAWTLFLYLDWPAKPGVRGVPDPAQPLGASPVVWQTWKEVHETYLAGGAAPPPWNDGGPSSPPTASLTEIDGTTLTDANGNPITYTVLLNQGTFEYLVSRLLYAFTGQAALRNPGAAPVQFPPSAMEVKASWRILDPVADKDRIGHYLTASLLLPTDNGNPPTKVTVGLTGLHVTSKALPNWIWITFEQVENPTTTGVQARLPMDPAVAKTNAAMQQQLAGTPFAYYQLMGVQTQYTVGGQPTLLANTQIETKFQTSSSCITCHQRASISTGKVARLDFFTMKAGNFAGVTGEPDMTPFGPGPNQYTALDFVWSMREAKQPVHP